MRLDKNDSDYYYIIVRTNIKKYRLKANLTTQQLADKSEFTHQFLRDLESLKVTRRPRLDTIGRIANALDIDIKKLFDDIEE